MGAEVAGGAALEPPRAANDRNATRFSVIRRRRVRPPSARRRHADVSGYLPIPQSPELKGVLAQAVIVGTRDDAECPEEGVFAGMGHLGAEVQLLDGGGHPNTANA
jgi:hypothetical protein